jgi:S-adenosyl-L-methionine hydrolase (adenosine-forming)
MYYKKQGTMIITLTTDFGKQAHGIAAMKLVIYRINPCAKIIDYAHGLPDFDVVSASRTMECLWFSQPTINVCVIDPGVGTDRRSLAIMTKSGHIFVGPDNGIFPSACKLMGGIIKANEITNLKLMNDIVTPIFHGRDIFAPAAAHISKGVDISEFGPEVEVSSLVQAPYLEAQETDGIIKAEVIAINKFHSIHINILWDVFDSFTTKIKSVNVKTKEKNFTAKVVNTFGEATNGEIVILKDDFGLVQLATNRGNLNIELGLGIGSKITLEKKY